MKAKLLRSLYLLAVGLALAAGVAGQTILKVGSILPPNSPEIQAITFMAERSRAAAWCCRYSLRRNWERSM